MWHLRLYLWKDRQSVWAVRRRERLVHLSFLRGHSEAVLRMNGMGSKVEADRSVRTLLHYSRREVMVTRTRG